MTFGEIILLALAISSFSMTVTKANAFDWVRWQVSKLGYWPEELINCPYCLSHWLAIPSVIALHHGTWTNLVLTIFAVVTLASLASLGITCLFLALNVLDEWSDE